MVFASAAHHPYLQVSGYKLIPVTGHGKFDWMLKVPDVLENSK